MSEVKENIKHNLTKIMGYKPARVFAEETGLKISTIYYILNGGNTDIDNYVTISKFSGVSLDDLCKTKIQE